MRVYTRDEIREMIDRHRAIYKAESGYKLTLEAWCKTFKLYYSGVVRFLKGADITLNNYCKILAAADPDRFDRLPTNHYLGEKIFYSHVNDLQKYFNSIAVALPGMTTTAPGGQ